MANAPSQETKDEIEKYKDAVWSYIMEHCDILPSGKIFVKFHTDGRRNFENRVWARYRYNYHREDWEAKQEAQQATRSNFKTSRLEKKKLYIENKRKRRQDYEQRHRMEQWSKWYERTQQGGIFCKLWGVLSSITWKRKPQN